MVRKMNAARAEVREEANASADLQQQQTPAWNDQLNAGGLESPARRLQLDLEREWAGAEPARRWSARRSLAFILFTNTLLWAALIWGIGKIA